MVSYMTGPALMEAITAVLADRDVHELIVVDNGNNESARARLSELTAKRNRVFDFYRVTEISGLRGLAITARNWRQGTIFFSSIRTP